MIKYHKPQNVIEIDLHDLEECGFDFTELWDLLWMQGIGDEAALMPDGLMVHFGGGHVVTDESKDDEREARRAARERFKALVEKALS